MAVRCTTGTFLDRMNEAIQFAEGQRAYAVKLSKEISQSAQMELLSRVRARRGPMPSQAQLDAVGDQRVGEDSRWKVAVADEQWGWRLATMYALADAVVNQRRANQIHADALDAQREANLLSNELLRAMKIANAAQQQLLAEQQTTNALLRQMLSGRPNSTDAPAPLPRRNDVDGNVI